MDRPVRLGALAFGVLLLVLLALPGRGLGGARQAARLDHDAQGRAGDRRRARSQAQGRREGRGRQAVRRDDRRARGPLQDHAAAGALRRRPLHGPRDAAPRARPRRPHGERPGALPARALGPRAAAGAARPDEHRAAVEGPAQGALRAAARDRRGRPRDPPRRAPVAVAGTRADDTGLHARHDLLVLAVHALQGPLVRAAERERRHRAGRRRDAGDLHHRARDADRRSRRRRLREADRQRRRAQARQGRGRAADRHRRGARPVGRARGRLPRHGHRDRARRHGHADGGRAERRVRLLRARPAEAAGRADGADAARHARGRAPARGRRARGEGAAGLPRRQPLAVDHVRALARPRRLLPRPDRQVRDLRRRRPDRRAPRHAVHRDRARRGGGAHEPVADVLARLHPADGHAHHGAGADLVLPLPGRRGGRRGRRRGAEPRRGGDRRRAVLRRLRHHERRRLLRLADPHRLPAQAGAEPHRRRHGEARRRGGHRARRGQRGGGRDRGRRRPAQPVRRALRRLLPGRRRPLRRLPARAGRVHARAQPDREGVARELGPLEVDHDPGAPGLDGLPGHALVPAEPAARR